MNLQSLDGSRTTEEPSGQCRMSLGHPLIAHGLNSHLLAGSRLTKVPSGHSLTSAVQWRRRRGGHGDPLHTISRVGHPLIPLVQNLRQQGISNGRQGDEAETIELTSTRACVIFMANSGMKQERSHAMSSVSYLARYVDWKYLHCPTQDRNRY